MEATYYNERRVIKMIFAINIDADTDQFLTLAQVPVSTSKEKVVELIARVQRVLISQDTAFDHQTLLTELCFKLVLSERHFRLGASGGGEQPVTSARR